jgi:hypothetical protein
VLAELQTTHANQRSHPPDSALIYLEVVFDRGKVTLSCISPATPAPFFITPRYLSLRADPPQPPAPVLACLLVYPQHHAPIKRCRVSSLLKRPATDHTVGFHSARGIDRSHRLAAGTLRSGVIED